VRQGLCFSQLSSSSVSNLQDTIADWSADHCCYFVSLSHSCPRPRVTCSSLVGGAYRDDGKGGPGLRYTTWLTRFLTTTFFAFLPKNIRHAAHWSRPKQVDTEHLQTYMKFKNGWRENSSVKLLPARTLLLFQIPFVEILRVCPWENQAEPGRRWYSSNHRFRSNLAQMLGLVSEWLWQNSRSKYFIPFKLVGPPAKMPIWH